MYKKSKIWEGLFIELFGDQLSKPVILGNVYRPPFENNNNHIIEMFVEQFSPVMHSINDRNLQAIVAGDFNINLLKIQEREKYCEFLDLMCTNELYPKITFPTRFARKSCSLIDQIYCRFHSPNIIVSPVVVKSHISDHCPCFLSINIFQSKTHNPKYVTIRKITPERIESSLMLETTTYQLEESDSINTDIR